MIISTGAQPSSLPRWSLAAEAIKLNCQTAKDLDYKFAAAGLMDGGWNDASRDHSVLLCLRQVA